MFTNNGRVRMSYNYSIQTSKPYGNTSIKYIKL